MHIQKGVGSLMLAILLIVGSVSVFAGGDPEGAVELTMWDNYLSGTDNELFELLVAKYMEENPGTTIERNLISFQDMQQTIRPALASGAAPDVIYYNTGPAYTSILAKNDLLLNLDSYEPTYGWRDSFPSWIYNQGTYNGSLYALGTEVFFQGVYYNKDIFTELGYSVPESYAEFIEIAQAAVDAGYVGVSLSDGDGWPGYHHAAIYATAVAGKTDVERALSGEIGFNDRVFGRAFGLLGDLVAGGLSSADPNAISFQDANREFFSGMSAMRFGGSWLISEVDNGLGDSAGFFALPPLDQGIEAMPAGGIGAAFIVAAATEHPDESVRFIDFMLSERNSQTWLEKGTIPPISTVDPQSLEVSDLFAELIGIAQSPAGMAYNLDTILGPEANDALLNGIQSLLAGRINGQEVADDLHDGMLRDVEEEVFFYWEF